MTRLPLTYAELIAAYAPKTGGAFDQATGIYTDPR